MLGVGEVRVALVSVRISLPLVLRSIAEIDIQARLGLEMVLRLWFGGVRMGFTIRWHCNTNSISKFNLGCLCTDCFLFYAIVQEIIVL